MLSAINAITKQSLLAKCQANFLRARKESLTANEMIALGDFVENYSSLCKMKSEVTIGAKNTAHYTHSLYILLTVMEIFNTILFHNFVDKIQSLLITLKETFQLWIRSSISLTAVLNGRCSMVSVRADLEDRLKSKTVPGTRSSHHFVPIFCNKIAGKITSEDREFLQFNFDRSLTEEIDIKISSVFRMSAVSTIHFGGLA